MTLEPSALQKTEMEKIAAGLPTKSAKIRALAERGYSRADIARFLGIRYQHVRNVLLQPLAGRLRNEAQAPEELGAREETARFVEADEAFRVYRFQIDSEGRIKLPSDLLALLDATPGSLITAHYQGGELRLMGIEASVRFVQNLAAPYIKPGEGNWSDQLIAERRAEAERENREDDR
jgi:hypothetical protein